MIVEKTKNILFYTNGWINWLILLLFTADLLLPGFNYADHFYPLDVLLLTIIAFWLYHFRLRLFALLPLLLALLINIQHWGRGSHVFPHE